MAALAVAGLADGPVLLRGLPARQGRRAAPRIAEIAAIPATLVLFETGPRLAPPRTLRRGSARARRRSAASSPSCTRRCAARRSGDARPRLCGPRCPARRDRDRDRSAGERSRTATSTGCCARAWQDKRQGCGGRGRGERRGAATRRLSARALALAKGTAMTRPMDPRLPLRRSRRRGRERRSRSGSASAETRAAALLLAKGFRIVARRWRQPGRGRSISWRGAGASWCSSRSRRRGVLDDAAEAVTPRQQRRISAAARAWLGASRRGPRSRHPVRRRAGRAVAPAAPHSGSV